jgi:hypothetical protein
LPALASAYLYSCRVLTSMLFGLDYAAHFHEVKRKRDKKKEVRYTLHQPLVCSGGPAECVSDAEYFPSIGVGDVEWSQ